MNTSRESYSICWIWENHVCSYPLARASHMTTPDVNGDGMDLLMHGVLQITWPPVGCIFLIQAGGSTIIL